MSYDVTLTVDTGGDEPHWVAWFNITYNLQPMFAEAGFSVHDWSGKRAGDVAPTIREAVRVMIADPPRFQAHNPPNGWGNYTRAVSWLEEVAAAMEEHPDTIVRTT